MIQKLNKAQEKKVYNGLVYLNDSSSEVYFLMKDTSIRTDPDIETAYAAWDKVNKKFVICIRSQWIETFDTHNMAAIIEHELYHIVLCHVVQFDLYDDWDIANLSWDAIINDLAHTFKDRKKLNSELQRGVFLDRVVADLKATGIINNYTRISAKETTCRQLYDLLLKLQAKMPQIAAGYQTTDDHSTHEKGNGQGDGEKGDKKGEQGIGGLAEAKEQLEALSRSKEARDIMEGLMGSEGKEGESVRAIGKGSADMIVVLQGYYKARRIKDFKKSINNFYSCAKNYLKKTSLKKPSKRYPNPYGKIKQKKAKIKMGIDVSGSQLNDECIEKINIAICNALDLNIQVDVVSGDTKKLYEKKNVSRTWDFRECLKGGGGTELEFFFHNNNGDVVDEATTYVIVTDGMFDKKDIPTRISRNKIIFLSTYKEDIFGYKTLKI